MPEFYHVTTRADWEQAKVQGEYVHPSLAIEGFIHCSQEHQVAGVLERYFVGQKDLVKLTVSTELLKSKYVYDWSESTQDTFPHIYGPINLDAVTKVTPL